MSDWIMRKLMAWWIRRNYGERCEYMDVGCCCCKAWLMYDWLFADDVDDWNDAWMMIWTAPGVKWDRAYANQDGTLPRKVTGTDAHKTLPTGSD